MLTWLTKIFKISSPISLSPINLRQSFLQTNRTSDREISGRHHKYNKNAVQNTSYRRFQLRCDMAAHLPFSAISN